MRLLQAPRQLLRHASPNQETTRPEGIRISARRGAAETFSCHDTRPRARRAAPAADPYAAWLEQREAERKREARRLNPRDAWDDLRLEGFCVIGR